MSLLFRLSRSLRVFNKAYWYFIGAKLEDDIDIQMVFEVVSKVNNVGMGKTLMNFDLAHQFLLRSGFDERALLDDFDGLHIFGLLRDKFIAACEATLAQKITLDVTL